MCASCLARIIFQLLPPESYEYGRMQFGDQEATISRNNAVEKGFAYL